MPRPGTSAASILAAAGIRADYQLQLPQTPVKDIDWLQVGQTSPIFPSFMLERASPGDSAREAIHVLHARRVCSLFFCRQFRRTQNGSVAPLEVAAIGVVPQSGFRSRSAAVEVNRVHHVSDIWMPCGARHGGHFTVRIAP